MASLKFQVQIEVENSAFEDNPSAEVAWILREKVLQAVEDNAAKFADFYERRDCLKATETLGGEFCETNGNKCGHWVLGSW